MRILGIDYGDKRVGIAITDELESMAHPLKVVSNSGSLSEVKKIIKEYGNIKKIVVGLPISFKGEVSFKAKQVLKWIKTLKGEVTVPVETFDERFSSIEAEELLISLKQKYKERKKVIDKLAAGIILQNYLESTKGEKLNC